MGDVEIKGKISVDTAGAAKSTSELNAEIKNTKKVLSEAKIGSEEYKAAHSALKKSQEELTKSTSAANSEHGKTSEAFATLKEKMGGLVPGFKGASEGATTFGSTLKLLAVNPIVLILVAIVAALKFLYDAFTSTKEGAEKVEAVFAGISAVITVVAQRVMMLGRAVIEFFSGHWSKAAADAKGAMTGVLDEIEQKYNRAVELKKKEQELEKKQLADSLNMARRKANLAELKEMLADENVSAKEKIAIAKKVLEESKRLAKDETETAKQFLNNQLETLQMKSGLSQKEFQDQFDLQTRLDRAATEIEKEEIQKQLEAIQNKSLLSQDEFKKQYEAQITFETKKRDNEKNVMQAEKAEKNAKKQLANEEKAADAEQKAKEKEAHDKAKQEKLERIAYFQRLRKSDQEIELAQMKDGRDKELTVLRNKLDEEKQVNKASVADGKISKEQEAELNLKIDKLYILERKKITEKFQAEEKVKTKIFEDELRKIRLDIELMGIEDIRVREMRQLQISYDDKFKLASEKYKDNAKRLLQITLLLEAEKEMAIKKLEQKFADEDRKSGQVLSLRKIALEESRSKNEINKLRKLLTEKQSIINQQYKDEISAAGITAARKADIEQKHVEDLYGISQAKKAIDLAEFDSKLKTITSIGGLLSNLSNLIGAQTVTGKALAVSSALIDTYAAITATLRQASKSPGGAIPGYAIAQAVATGVAGLATVQKIISVPVPGGSGGGAPALSNVAAPLAPSPQNTTTSLNQSSINGIGNAAGQGTARAFVLDSDINNNQERATRINRAARLN